MIYPIHNLTRTVILHQNHILVCKSHQAKIDYYFLPGGHIESGESAKQAALRELFEESAHTIVIDRFLGCLESSFTPHTLTKKTCHTHEYNIIFQAHFLYVNNPFEIVSQESHIGFYWIPLSELNHINLLPALLKDLIPQWLTNSTHEAFISDMDN